MTVREPRLTTLAINELRPTQITVGRREVLEKRKRWRELKHKARFLGSHLIPVVHGYKGRFYIIDHHHLALALTRRASRRSRSRSRLSSSMLDQEAFWSYLDNRALMHAYDQQGRRCHYRDLPRRVEDLIDDPYRSLAGELRRLGGYSKDTTPFSEFLWADFLRRRIKRTRVERNFVAALDRR